MLNTYSYYKHNTTPFRKKVKTPHKNPKNKIKTKKTPNKQNNISVSLMIEVYVVTSNDMVSSNDKELH